jgi:hypothetical protein
MFLDPKYVVIVELNDPPFFSHVGVNDLHQPLLFFLQLEFFFNKQLGMCKINLSLHGNVPINFGILNQPLFQKKLWARTLPTTFFDLQIT